MLCYTSFPLFCATNWMMSFSLAKIPLQPSFFLVLVLPGIDWPTNCEKIGVESTGGDIDTLCANDASKRNWCDECKSTLCSQRRLGYGRAKRRDDRDDEKPKRGGLQVLAGPKTSFLPSPTNLSKTLVFSQIYKKKRVTQSPTLLCQKMRKFQITYACVQKIWQRHALWAKHHVQVMKIIHHPTLESPWWTSSSPD